MRYANALARKFDEFQAQFPHAAAWLREQSLQLEYQDLVGCPCRTVWQEARHHELHTLFEARKTRGE